MQLDWRQAQMLCNVAVLDSDNLLNGLALDPAWHAWHKLSQTVLDDC